MSMNPPEPHSVMDPEGVFLQLARIVYARSTYEDIFAAIAETAVALIPGCDHASVTTLRSSGELVTEGASDDVARTIDDCEREAGEGPCLNAILSDAYQHDPDLTGGSTWPKLTELVLERTPVRGMIGYRLLVEGRKGAALDVFSDRPDALTGHSADVGVIVASFASVALAGSAHNDRAENLQKGLSSNREIGKAIGLLMAVNEINDEQAFEMLKTASSQLNIKLAELARRVVDEHRQPK